MVPSSSKRKRQGTAHQDDGLFEDLSQEAHPKKARTPISLPPVSRYLPIVLGGKHWDATRSLENIVIFGDSYSRWNDGQTWVDHLRLHMQRQGYPYKMHNFSFRGATVEGNLSDQLLSFTELANEKSNDKGLQLESDETTCFIFLGINDCGSTEYDEIEPIVVRIFDALHHLYVKARVRNFILVDIPPIDRSPQAIDSEVVEEMENRVETWNELLRQQTTEFGLTNEEEGTVLLFSSHRLLMEVLDDPLEYDFSEDDVTTEVGGIWADDFHLTSEVHGILGEKLLTALEVFTKGGGSEILDISRTLFKGSR